MTILDTKIKRIRNICKNAGIKNYHINDDYSVDVNEDVCLVGFQSNQLPFQFGKVMGDFDCRRSLLTTLKGSPVYVGGNFRVTDNELTTLEHCPKVICENFFASGNLLTTLKYFPESIGGFISIECDQSIYTKDSENYYEHILHILQSSEYPYYNFNRMEQLVYPTTDFLSWLRSMERIQTIEDIINGD